MPGSSRPTPSRIQQAVRGQPQAGPGCDPSVPIFQSQDRAIEDFTLKASYLHESRSSTTILTCFATMASKSKRLTENELSDFSRLWHDGCVKAIIEAQDVDRNH